MKRHSLTGQLMCSSCFRATVGRCATASAGTTAGSSIGRHGERAILHQAKVVPSKLPKCFCGSVVWATPVAFTTGSQNESGYPPLIVFPGTQIIACAHCNPKPSTLLFRFVLYLFSIVLPEDTRARPASYINSTRPLLSWF